VMWKPLGSTDSCLLLEALVDLDDNSLRTKILQTAVSIASTSIDETYFRA